MSLCEDALRLSTRFPVFPLTSEKRPCWGKREGGHGFHDATQEAEEIERLFGHRAAALIGIPTGEKTGFDVLDIDPKHDGHIWLEEAIDSLPITRIQDTRSGGKHFYFRHLDGVKISEGVISHGVDVRGQGGYVVAWGAHGYDIQNPDIIADWPQWLAKLLKPKETPKRHIPVPANSAERDTRAALMIDRAYQRVRNAGPGQRHYHLRAAAATLGGLARYIGYNMDKVEHDLVELVMQAGAQDRQNAERTVRWAINKGYSSPLLTAE